MEEVEGTIQAEGTAGGGVAEEKQVMGRAGEIVSKGNGGRTHRVRGPRRTWILPWVRWATILGVM